VYWDYYGSPFAQNTDQDFVKSLILKHFGSMDTELLAVVPNIIKLLPLEFTLLLIDLSL
jgi:hypothetical protein